MRGAIEAAELEGSAGTTRKADWADQQRADESGAEKAASHPRYETGWDLAALGRGERRALAALRTEDQPSAALRGAAAAERYRPNARTGEHVHDEVRNALAAAHMLSQRSEVNAVWFTFALMDYNFARAIKGLCLDAEERTSRFKRYLLLMVHVGRRMNRNNCVMGLRLWATREIIARIRVVCQAFRSPSHTTSARRRPTQDSPPSFSQLTPILFMSTGAARADHRFKRFACHPKAHFPLFCRRTSRRQIMVSPEDSFDARYPTSAFIGNNT
jgi:hypothetical protein